MRTPILFASLLLVALAPAWLRGQGAGGAEPAGDVLARARAFIRGHEEKARPLEKESALAWWTANTSGKDADFKAKEEAQNRLDAFLSDRDRFKELSAVREGLRARPERREGDEPLLRRQIEVLHLQYLEKQVDPELLRRMTALANAVEKAFNVYRPVVRGKEVTESEVRRALKESRDSKERKEYWDAQKGVGPVVAGDLAELVRLRNEAAKKLGFPDYHALQLHLSEQSQEEVLRLFDELHALTEKPFREAKEEIDRKLAADCGVSPADLQPWHYHDPFFQEAPHLGGADFDAVYRGADVVTLCRTFYAGIGLPVDDVLERSDLHEKPGKSPHAFCTDIDREGDVRVLANIVPNEYWMGTMLHELGHAVYSSKFIPRSLPYVLRGEAHILATEGMAMMFEKFSKSADWLGRMGVLVTDPAALEATGRKLRRNRLLVFAAWAQVMFRFEKEMYRDPAQDLSRLWWGLVEKHQGLRRPEGRSAPDYASKIHVVSAPAYYHNYLLGQLFASQLHHALTRAVLKEPPSSALYNGRKEVGEFLRARVFAHGRSLSWNDLTRAATGEPLNARAFAEDLR